MLERNRIFDFIVLLCFGALALLPWAAWLGDEISLTAMLAGPSAAHPLGTDNLGRDLLVRCAAAVQGAVLPLWGGVLLGSLIGLGLGLVLIESRGRKGLRWLAVFGQTSGTILASIPVGIAAFAWAVLAEKAGIMPVLMAVSVLFAVRVMLQTLDLYRHDQHLGFWDAHLALGGSLGSRLVRYGLLGSWKWRLLDGLGFHLRAAVAIEASLSYLGFGIQEPQASFGNMLASHFDTYLKGDFYSLIVIVAMLALTAGVPGSFVSLAKGIGAVLLKKRGFHRDSMDLANPKLSRES